MGMILESAVQKWPDPHGKRYHPNAKRYDPEGIKACRVWLSEERATPTG